MQSRRERLKTREQSRLDDQPNRWSRPRQREREYGYEGDHGIQAVANGMPDRDGRHV